MIATPNLNIAYIEWEYEDMLPENVSMEYHYPGMYQASKVSAGIRLYPYIELFGQRIYLAEPASTATTPKPTTDVTKLESDYRKLRQTLTSLVGADNLKDLKEMEEPLAALLKLDPNNETLQASLKGIQVLIETLPPAKPAPPASTNQT